MLPPDGHVHTEWSWDTVAGSMERSCERAVALGLPSIAFTEHADFTSWELDPAQVAGLAEHLRGRVSAGRLRPPGLDVAGYLECIERCRSRFPELRIRSGIEVGEPHQHAGRLRELVGTGSFDRVLGSMHSLVVQGRPQLVDDVSAHRSADQLIRAYLGELVRMVEVGGGFAVLAHIDYPVRYWPVGAGRYDPRAFEAEYRAALRALAGTGRALELNTQVPLHAAVVRWWYEAGGEALCFGSDAHEPALVAAGFAEAARVAEAAGFRPGRHPHDFWLRARRSASQAAPARVDSP